MTNAAGTLMQLAQKIPISQTFASAVGRDFKLMPGRTLCHLFNSQVKACSFVVAEYIRRVPFRPLMVSLDKKSCVPQSCFVPSL